MNNISSVSFQGSKVEQQKEKKNIKGALLASMASSFAISASVPFGLLAVNGLTKYSRGLTKDEIEIANKGAQQVIDQVTNLGKKGVKIVDADGMSTMFNAQMPEWLLNIYSPIDAAANGKNAFFTAQNICDEIKENTVFVNKKKLPLAIFHELGHAYNFNNSAFLKILQKSRTPLMYIAALFALIPAFTKDTKQKEGQDLTNKEKFINNLRKASPYIAGATMMPIALEEGIATLRGNKWAKEVFKNAPDLAKKVAKTNRFGFASYLISVAAVVLAAATAKKVKDASDEKLALRNNNATKREQGYHQG